MASKYYEKAKRWRSPTLGLICCFPVEFWKYGVGHGAQAMQYRLSIVMSLIGLTLLASLVLGWVNPGAIPIVLLLILMGGAGMVRVVPRIIKVYRNYERYHMPYTMWLQARRSGGVA